jgi:signal transduction histidine kinase
METFRTSAFVPLVWGIFLVVAFGFGLHTMYRRGVRRYQRTLDDTYSGRFEQRAILARSLHANLAQTIQRSKSVVDQVRENSPDAPKTEVALNQVAEWLDGAAGESDRALRSLENTPMTIFTNGYIARGEHVDSKTNSHHDR